MTALEIVKAVHESGLGNGATHESACCQFCGFGPFWPYVSPLHPLDGPHLPSCVWLEIERLAKA